jgi:hypothetical protein
MICGSLIKFILMFEIKKKDRNIFDWKYENKYIK